MTANQIAYWSYKENARHNLETEAFNVKNLDEVRRHNLAYESETQRHNQQTEYLNRLNLSELKRHNLATEAHNASILEETVRSNVTRENETVRSNVARELENARVNSANILEARRSNVAREEENKRANIAREDETKRANLVKEQQNAYQLQLNTAGMVINGVETLFDVFNDSRKTSSQVFSNVASAVSKIIPVLGMVG